MFPVFLAVAATAQVRVGMTPLGYALDETARGVRPLVGTPGSAYFGPLTPLPFPVRQAVIRGGVGVVISEEGVAFRAGALEGEDFSTMALGAAKRVWMDTEGRMAVMETPDGELRVVANLRTAPQVGPLVSAGAVSAVAFLESEQCALVASAEETSTALRRLCAYRPGEAVWLRTVAEPISEMAYARSAGLFYSSSGRQLLRLRNPVGSGVPELIHQGPAPLAGLTVTGPEEVWAAYQDSGTLAVWSSGSLTFVDLPAPARQLALLAANRLLACTPLSGDEPMLLLDLLQDRAAFFVPVLRSSQ